MLYAHHIHYICLILFHVPPLAVCRHIDRRLRRDRIFTPPKTCHCLLLCVELETWLSVESVCTAACDLLLVTSEGEHGELLILAIIRYVWFQRKLTGTGMGTLIPT